MVRGIRFVKKLGAVKEYALLKNGLKILLCPSVASGEGGLCPEGISDAIGFMAHYNVGSRNEGVGHTGAAHALEHLSFCGSKSFLEDKQSAFDLFARVGAFANATTSCDCTNYYEICLPESLPACMAIEADRMRNAVFTAENWEEEKEIVRNEFEIGENSPASRLRELVKATAIIQHPYHHPVIGWASDINGVSVERIRQFYDTFYWPNNAAVIVAGNFNENEVLKMILANFGKVKRSRREIPKVYTEEPIQQGERRVKLTGPGGNGTILFAWRAAAASSPEFAAFVALQYMLTNGRRSLLQREFVVPGRVHEISSGLGLLKDPFLFFLRIKLFSKDGHSKIEQDMRAFLLNLADKGVSKEHIDRAKLLAEADLIYAGDGLIPTLMQLSSAESAGSWELWYQLSDEIRDLDADKVTKVFRDYFKDDSLTVGWFMPQNPVNVGGDA